MKVAGLPKQTNSLLYKISGFAFSDQRLSACIRGKNK